MKICPLEGRESDAPTLTLQGQPKENGKQRSEIVTPM